jgi:dTDP-4-dehydrorhamnose reductase
VANIILLGKGYVGTHLYNSLKQNTNFHVSSICRAEVDYFDTIALKKYIRENIFLNHNTHDDYIIINCSGFTGRPNVDQCESNKELCFKLNTKLPVKLSYFCKKNNYWLLNVSSGCIYTGYEKEFTEEDQPNFGIYNPESSFYSKCKHLAEELCNLDSTTFLRIRMPFCGYSSDRNFINKILKYDNLISYSNSLTCIEDFAVFVEQFIKNKYYKSHTGIYNVVNKGSANAKDVVLLLSKYNHINKNWKFVEIKDLNLKANRSNCILSDEKITSMNLKLPNVIESLERCISTINA